MPDTGGEGDSPGGYAPGSPQAIMAAAAAAQPEEPGVSDDPTLPVEGPIGEGPFEGPTVGVDMGPPTPEGMAQERFFAKFFRALTSPVAKGALAVVGVAALISPIVGGPIVLSMLAMPALFWFTGKADSVIGLGRLTRVLRHRRQMSKAKQKEAGREHQKAMAQHQAKQREREAAQARGAESQTPQAQEAPVAEARDPEPRAPEPPVVRPGQDPATVRGTPEAGQAVAMAGILKRLAEGSPASAPELRRELRSAILNHYNPASRSQRVRDFGAALLEAGAAPSAAAAQAIAVDVLGAHGLMERSRQAPGTGRPAAARPAASAHEAGVS